MHSPKIRTLHQLAFLSSFVSLAVLLLAKYFQIIDQVSSSDLVRFLLIAISTMALFYWFVDTFDEGKKASEATQSLRVLWILAFAPFVGTCLYFLPLMWGEKPVVVFTIGIASALISSSRYFLFGRAN
jgi:hypothetical protein